MNKRIDKEITKENLCDLYKLVICRLKAQREHHTPEQREGYDIRKPFAVALCQGAAMHYLGKPNIKGGKKYKGVKDFDIWCFYKKNDIRFRFSRSRLIDEYCSKEFGERKVDILMRAIDYTSNPIHSIQNWLKTSGNQSPRYLSQKAVILICPEIKPIWCEGKVYGRF